MTPGSRSRLCAGRAAWRTTDVSMPMRWAALAVRTTRGRSLPLTCTRRDGPSSLAASLLKVSALPQPATASARAAAATAAPVRLLSCMIASPWVLDSGQDVEVAHRRRLRAFGARGDRAVRQVQVERGQDEEAEHRRGDEA